MPDWSASMQQTYEYYRVDPSTWTDVERIENVKKCTITRDGTVETLGSATFSIDKAVGEIYIRTYLSTIQNGVKERFPLGTHLVQTPSSSFNGKITTFDMDAYTPLLELKEKHPPIGYALTKGQKIMDMAYMLTRENARAPVSDVDNNATLSTDFVSTTNDTWLTFISDLMVNANFSYKLDDMGRILFAPNQETAALQPVWTYDDGNISILCPELDMDHDLYDIPNVVEVVYSTDTISLYAKAVNSDPNSPTSTVSRGREVTRRITDPEILGNPTQTIIQQYANRILRELSSVECKISYTHGYCPVRIGDCVRLNYTRAGLNGVKAKVIKQTIRCESGCQVDETAVFTMNLMAPTGSNEDFGDFLDEIVNGGDDA